MFLRPNRQRSSPGHHQHRQKRMSRRHLCRRLLLRLFFFFFFLPAGKPGARFRSDGDDSCCMCSEGADGSLGSSLVELFHFSSRAFPPPDGPFLGRIQWRGVPARGDASLALINATLSDNGTYTCSVRNPPDVHGSPTSHTVLTVTPRVASVRFSDVAVLLAFVLLPSTIITFILIGRMFCPNKQSKAYRSPIEVTEGEEHGAKARRVVCCDPYMLNSEDEDGYYDLKKRPPVDEGYAESQC